MIELANNIKKVLAILEDTSGRKKEGPSREKLKLALQEGLGLARLAQMLQQGIQNLSQGFQNFQGQHFNALFNRVQVIQELLISKEVFTNEEFKEFHTHIIERPILAMQFLQQQSNKRAQEMQKLEQEHTDEESENPNQDRIDMLREENRLLAARIQGIQTYNYKGVPTPHVEAAMSEYEKVEAAIAEARKKERETLEAIEAAKQAEADVGSTTKTADEGEDTIQEAQPVG